MEQDKNVAEEVNDPVDSEKQLIYEKEVVVESESHSNGNDVSVVVESTSSATQEDTPKKSYASIVSLYLKIFQSRIFMHGILMFNHSYRLKCHEGVQVQQKFMYLLLL